ncbi:TetR/AcrR family transcriptional regulator C-terminal domain-containing protein [Brevibacterium sanguinis]|uniref:TetR/AcrR family transcriptional regulator C-terminal domain-containing protein n=2 Tax=Brevibacteriaceae TaxID=85019 RepID=A0A7T4DK13_9MICO|nr:TetR/AcrR family transcriptional regulator C-terminal domain-containing protein [Brevibacterium casei]
MARQRLRQEDIVKAAIAYIDEFGVQSLSMRRLGMSLDVEAMALYNYVSGREQLVSLAVDELIDDLFDEELMQEQPESWEAFLRFVATAMRDLALGHPRMFPLMITQPPEAPWLRPPLRSVRWVDYFLTALTEYGFSDDRVVDTYKAFTSFLLGQLVLEVSAMGIDIASTTDADADADADSDEDEGLSGYPTLKQLQAKLAEDHSDREFDDGLDDLIERIRAIKDT